MFILLALIPGSQFCTVIFVRMSQGVMRRHRNQNCHLTSEVNVLEERDEVVHRRGWVPASLIVLLTELNRVLSLCGSSRRGYDIMQFSLFSCGRFILPVVSRTFSSDSSPSFRTLVAHILVLRNTSSFI